MEQPEILIIDDSISSVDLLFHMLKGQFQVMVAFDGASAKDILMNQCKPSLVIMDMILPDLNGRELFLWMSGIENLKEIPVIMISGVTEESEIDEMYQLGIRKFLNKPINRSDLMELVDQNILNPTTLSEGEEWVAEKSPSYIWNNKNLFLFLLQSSHMINQFKQGNMNRTLNFNMLIRDFSSIIEISDEDQLSLCLAMAYRDMGMLHLPSHIVQKPEALQFDEWKSIQNHVNTTLDLIKNIENPLSCKLLEIIGNHHEHWNGKGYPKGLKKNEIPLLGRVAALLDSMDSLLSPRPYRPALSWYEVIQIIMEGQGSQFDPELCQCLWRNQNELSQCTNTNNQNDSIDEWLNNLLSNISD